MKNTNLITMLKFEIDNIEELRKYYKNIVDIKFFDFYINDILIRINGLIHALGGEIYYGKEN